MAHLNPEVLARLVDEAPSDAEREHLEACEACAGELTEYRRQTEALATLPSLRPDPGDWSLIEARLVSEGLVKGGSRLRRQLAYTPSWMKVSAVLALFAGGIGIGWGMAAEAATPSRSMNAPVVVRTTDPAMSLDEAARDVQIAQRRYIESMTRYRQLLEASDELVGFDHEVRIAALETLARVGKSAVREAPADPVLNSFLAYVMAERDAAVRAVSSGSGVTWY